MLWIVGELTLSFIAAQCLRGEMIHYDDNDEECESDRWADVANNYIAGNERNAAGRHGAVSVSPGARIGQSRRPAGAPTRVGTAELQTLMGNV